MTDGELYSSSPALTCEPEPLSSSMDDPMMSAMPTSATPSYLTTPAPASSTGPRARSTTGRRRRGATATSSRTPHSTPAVPTDPAAARRRYREGANWGPPPAPNMSVMPPSTTAGLSCDPSNMSCPSSDGSELLTSEMPTDGASADESRDGGGDGSGSGPEGGVGANGPGGVAGEEETNRSGGGNAAQERERKFQEKQEDMALAIPYTPLKVPEADTTDKRLYPLYIQVPTAGPGWSAPQKLEVQPTGDKRKIPPKYADYEQQFANTGNVAKSLYDQIVREGREQAMLAAQQLSVIQSDGQASLDRNLALLDERIGEERKRIEQGEREAIHRLELIADTARLLVRNAASSVLGTIAARKAVIAGRMAEAQAEATSVEQVLAGYSTQISTKGAEASGRFTQLASNPAPARLRGSEGEGSGYNPEATAAMNESPPMDPVIVARANNRAEAFTNGARVFDARLTTAAQQFQTSAINAFAPFQAYINMLGTTAPQQVAKMRRDALKTIDRTEKRAVRTIVENRNRAEIDLVEKHKAARVQTQAQAQTNMAGQARGLERNAINQFRSYAALASSQGQAIFALKQQITSQRGQPPENFAQFASQASQRTATTAERMAANRIAMLTSTGARTRGAMGQRAAQADRTLENSAEKQSVQLQQAAQQAATAMMQNMLAQESSMRQSAEPIAQSVDSYTIPASVELDEMESALWDALGVAQQQANQAYFGGGPPGEEGAEATTESPPPGTGSLPHEFVTMATRLSLTPETEEQLSGLTNHIGDVVWGKVSGSGDKLVRQMGYSNDPVATLEAVRGLTALRGAAVRKYYSQQRGGNDLINDAMHFINWGNAFSGVDTRVYTFTAFLNYIYGNRAAGALAEVQAATEYSNNNEQAMAAMEALSPADMAALRDLPGAGEILNAVEEDLGGNHAKAFHLLREATPENAAESAAAARSVLLTATIESDLQTGPESGADAAMDHMTATAANAGRTRLEQHDVYAEFGLVFGPELRTGSDAVSRPGDAAPLPDEFRFESSRERNARVANSWNMTVARLGTTDGTIPTDGRLSGMAWLQNTLSRTRTYGDGEYSYEANVRQEQINLITELARRGPDDPRVRARRMIVEETRAGGPNRTRMEGALQDDLGNAGLFNPDEVVTPEVARQRREQLAAATAREADMYHFYDCFRQGIEDEAVIADTPRRPVSMVKRELGDRLSERAGGGSEGALLRRQVVYGLTDPSTAALAFHNAVTGAGTNEQMLKDTFGRMSPEQVTEAVAYYDSHYGPPGLYERLGIFGEAQGTFDFPELSGDDAIDIQVLAMGRARNTRERFQVSHMTSKLQRDNRSTVGAFLAGEESDRLDASHAGIMNAAGVTEASFDRFGRLRRGQDGAYMGRWTSDGSFRPAAFDATSGMRPGQIFDSIMFGASLSTNESNAEAYKVAVDNIASTITTAIIVITAIVTTAVTFGGAASIWIPVGIALAGGLAAMAVNATLKGGRYGYEDAFRDLGMTIVQAATAGLASGLNIAAVGGKAALSAALAGRLVQLGSKAPSFMAQLGIGAASGAFGGAGNALFDDQAWDNGTWLSGIGHGFVRGGISGGVSAGVTASLTTGISAGGQALAGRMGRLAGYGSAVARGATGFSRSRAAVLAGQRFTAAASNSFALSQLGRTVGGGLGGAASRFVEIQYDRGRGAYKGSNAQAMDEIFAAGVQNAVQSFGEGAAEHAVTHSTRAGNMQRRYIDAMIVSGPDGNPAVIRRPAANDNSDPVVRQLWKDFDRPRSGRIPPDDNSIASMRAERELELRGSRRPTDVPADTDTADAAHLRNPDAANDNDTAPTTRPLVHDDDGNITTRLPPADPDAELAFPARSPLTGDDAEAARLLRQNPDVDPDRVMNTFDPDKTPVDGMPAVKVQDVEAAYQQQQKLPPRTLQDHIDSYDGAIGRRVYATADLSDRDMARLGHMPENSRIMASNARDLDAAMHNYQKMMAHDRNREVMLVQDRVTGMYMVVQGGPTSVTVPGGQWNVVQHSHPRIIDTNLNDVLVRSIPSGKPGDIHTVMREVDAMITGVPSGMTISRTSVIDIQVADAAGNVTVYQTRFGVVGEGNNRAIWVEFHNPKNGYAVERHGFSNLAEYEAHVLRTTGVDLTKQGAEAVQAVTPARTVRPPVSHGDAIPPQVRTDIAFVSGRMTMHADFDAQVQGLRARGDLDPHLGRAATLEDAHARVRAMGLVGEPDSMIRLYNIINDESIPLPVRTMISDITLAATQRHMVETGQLAAGEPLIMLFHGATGARARDMTENGISMARKPGGEGDDFGEGLYFTRHLESASVYATGRGGTRQGADGAVIPYLVRGGDLGAVVNVRTGGQHRAAWEAFVSANSHLFAKIDIDPDFLRLPSTMEALLSGKPLPFGTFDAEGRGKVFNAFLESLGGPQARPDVIFGDLGGPLTSGVQFKGGVTDQAVVRTQRLADILNEQHMRRPAVASVEDDAGMVVRSISGPEEDAASTSVKTVATDPMQPARAIVQSHIADGGQEVMQAIIDRYPNSRMKTKLQETLAGIPPEHHPALLKLLASNGSDAELFAAALPIRRAMREAGCNTAQIETVLRRVAFMREVAGPRFREIMGHFKTLNSQGFDATTSPHLARYIVDSPFLLHMAMTRPATLKTLFGKMAANRASNMPSSRRFEQMVRRSLQSPHYHADRMALQQSWPEKLAKGRASQAQPDIVETGEIVSRMLGYPPGDRVASGDAVIGPRLPGAGDNNPPLTAETPIIAGTRVFHPEKGEGTVRRVVNGVAEVSFDNGKTVNGIENINLAEATLHRAIDTITGDLQPIVPIREGGDLTAALNEVTAIRTDNKLDAFDANKESTGTVAIARIGEQRFDGFNSGMDNVSHPMTLADRQAMLSTLQKLGLLPSGTDLTSNQFLTHAEFSALYRAQQELGGLPPVVELFVDRETCAFCMNNLHIIAAHFGISELRIYYHNQTGPVPIIIKAKR